MEAVMEEHRAIRRKLMERYAEIRGLLERIASDANKPLDADFEEQAIELWLTVRRIFGACRRLMRRCARWPGMAKTLAACGTRKRPWRLIGSSRTKRHHSGALIRRYFIQHFLLPCFR